MVLKNKANKIKLIATDIDGVWTDTKMYYSKDGVFMKSFSTYDGMAIEMLHKNNFIVAMITSEYENVDILKSRAKKLNIHNVYINEHNKLNRLKYLKEKYKLQIDQIAYIGDDLNKDYENNEGSTAQKNDAHFIELASALSILNFANSKPSNSNEVKEFGIDVNTNNITFTDLNDKTKNTIFKPLTQYYLFHLLLIFCANGYHQSS